MSTPLRPDGRSIELEGVRIVSPGLRGRVDVFGRNAPGLRGADAAKDVLVDSLSATGMQEQRTIVIRDHAVDRGALSTAPTRSTRFEEPALAVTVPGPGTGMGQVMLAADEAGVMRWVFADDVPPAEAVTRGGEARTYTVPIAVAEEQVTGQRGLLGAIGKKVLKVFAFKLLDKVASELANHYASEWEQTAHPHRLRAFGPDDYRLQDVPALSAADLETYAEGPALLFVHGTMSLSHSGFGRLPPEVVQRLYDRYGKRVLAFDHPTVSVDPTANAAWLADCVAGAGLRVDIVAHSRGGLVSRVLAERPDTAGLAPGSLEVRSLTMVGTPNQGTALANRDHLGDLVDRVTNLLELIPDNAITDVVTIVISVVKQLSVAAFGGLDGLTAMAPGGKWLDDLNQSRPVTATYHAIASNYEPAPGSPLARLSRDRVVDFVFEKLGNDLIVPEAGVYTENGGAGFPVPGFVSFASTKSVDHSSYWTSPDVHACFDEWLVP